MAIWIGTESMNFSNITLTVYIINDVACRVSPDGSSNIKSILKKGEYYTSTKENDNWYLLEENGGWVNRKNIRLVSNSKLDIIQPTSVSKQYDEIDVIRFYNLSELLRFLKLNPSCHWLGYDIKNDHIELTIALFEVEFWTGFDVVKRFSINANVEDNNKSNTIYLQFLEKNRIRTEVETKTEVYGGIGNKIRDIHISVHYTAIPAEENHIDLFTYTVIPGDNVYDIANYFNITIVELKNANRGMDLYNLKKGDVLSIPKPKFRNTTLINNFNERSRDRHRISKPQLTKYIGGKRPRDKHKLTPNQLTKQISNELNKIRKKKENSNTTQVSINTPLEPWDESKLDYFDKSTFPSTWNNILSGKDKFRWTKTDTMIVTVGGLSIVAIITTILLLIF